MLILTALGVCFLPTAGDVRAVYRVPDGDGAAQAPPGVHAPAAERKAERHAKLHGALLRHQVSLRPPSHRLTPPTSQATLKACCTGVIKYVCVNNDADIARNVRQCLL